MATENISFNVLKHELVPEHDLLPEEEVEKILEKFKITRDQLPKIKTNDAAIKVLENVYERPIQEGSVIKIVRKSETAELFVAYRLVVGS
ncbi:MAG: DNA-directed RNA polymerase subunit H [Thermoplasmatales archaeon]|nr:DNA-directed RNA polymerase subunit H [Thermoplasmatales archaeon]